MNVLFYTGGAVAIVATFLVITRRNAVHALLYLILSLLSVALVFYSLGAAYVALLEIIIYAGAIMVLFLFAIMMLNLGSPEDPEHDSLLRPSTWAVPAVMAAILAVLFGYAILNPGPVARPPGQAAIVGPHALGDQRQAGQDLPLVGLIVRPRISNGPISRPVRSSVIACHLPAASMCDRRTTPAGSRSDACPPPGSTGRGRPAR